MHGLHHIDIIVAKGPLKHVYMDNETFDHRRGLFTDLNSFMSVQSIFKQFDEFEPHHHLVKCLNVSKKNASISASSDASIIINCHLEKSNLKLFKNSILVDCNIQSCNLTIGENSYLSDLNLVIKSFKTLKCHTVNNDCLLIILRTVWFEKSPRMYSSKARV